MVPPDHSIAIRFMPPPSDLADCLTSIYRLDLTVSGGQRLTDWLQPEWGNLRVFRGDRPDTCTLDGATLGNARLGVVGPTSHATRFVLGSTRMWGVGLLPLGWARLVRRPADAFANLVLDGAGEEAFAPFAPLADVFSTPASDDEEYDRIVHVLRGCNATAPDEDRICAVHAALVDREIATVADLAHRIALSPRALERICRRHFGFPPKLLLRRQRFMRSLAAFMVSEPGSWSAAIDEHYTDQAHFNHEFHDFMGMGPREYAALPHPILKAFMAERARVLHSAVQTLDRPSREVAGLVAPR